MAKSTQSRGRKSSSHSRSHAEHDERDNQQEQTPEQPAQAETAVAVAPPPPEPVRAPVPSPVSSPSEDVSSIDAETNAKYEQVKGGKLYIKDLQTMDMHDLHKIAQDEGIQDYVGMKKQDLIFQVLRARIRQNGLMYGEGVLEILPDGFGFLRSPEFNYIPGPDDIYISP
ncbi:MAG TPA: Rho termination factor N-terminal domain-containing protein, partial [Tepidisphaeraceae bacterium]